MSAIDYTPVLLAQLTDLQTRLTHQEATITALKAEVERLAGRSVLGAGPTMKSSVPLLPLASVKPMNGPSAPRGGPRPPRGPPASRDTNGTVTVAGATRRSRPQVAPTGDKHTHSLSDFLYVNDEVTLQVGTGKDAEGNFTHTTALATFDGTDLTVTQCDLLSSLVGLKSAKPGEILYKFIDGLLEAGHIKRKFTIAPWKLCSVVRNGQKVTLDELRNV